jgi:hypothetical protein
MIFPSGQVVTLPGRGLMFVFRRLDIFEAGKLICQVRRFVDEHRQALRAYKDIARLIMQVDERNLLFSLLTVQASFHWVTVRFPLRR